MRGKSHTKFAKILAPWMDEKVINQVNRSMDFPSKANTMISALYRDKKNGNRTAFDFPGLVKYPHRKNHDVLSATLQGLQIAGVQGALAANIHLMADSMRDRTNKRFGAKGSDILEAIFNYYQR